MSVDCEFEEGQDLMRDSEKVERGEVVYSQNSCRITSVPSRFEVTSP